MTGNCAPLAFAGSPVELDFDSFMYPHADASGVRRFMTPSEVIVEVRRIAASSGEAFTVDDDEIRRSFHVEWEYLEGQGVDPVVDMVARVLIFG